MPQADPLWLANLQQGIGSCIPAVDQTWRDAAFNYMSFAAQYSPLFTCISLTLMPILSC